MGKPLNFQEQAFVLLYLKYFDAKKAAIESGYTFWQANKAATWVSVTGTPNHKKHIRDAVADKIKELYGAEDIDKNWVLRRARLLADFTISRFIEVGEDGKAVFNFKDATPDDWYCIEEYTTQSSFQLIQEDGKKETIPVEKIKLKSVSKVAALRLIGDIVDVDAFKTDEERERPQISINIDGKTADQIREKMLKDDDC